MTQPFLPGLVVIGRNEGEHLRKCLQSIVGKAANIVYVDSGSTDDSTKMARTLGVEVIELDLSIPFTAARARNHGFKHLLKINSELEFVQFVDGDCEIVEGWLDCAQKELKSQSDVAVVCGRRRERFPQQSIYNRLCDMEWDTPVGNAKACGGDSMMRVEAFQQVDGFDPSLIAGEEPELCFRLRKNGWKILRFDAEMTLHDAQMMGFSQWWKRAIRSGHAYGEGAWLHGKSPERYCIRQSQSIIFWGLIVPMLSVALAFPSAKLSFSLLSVYPLLLYRIYQNKRKQNYSKVDALIYAWFCVLGKFPQLQGLAKFYLSRLLGRRSKLIEYKRF